MTTTIEEINVRRPECGRNAFESTDNGRCVYCGHQIEPCEGDCYESLGKYCDECERRIDDLTDMEIERRAIEKHDREENENIIEGVL